MQIFVLGMHRSGTSLAGRLVNLMGAYFGGEGVGLAANAENPKGYWERRDVIAINDRLLAARGASWYDIHPFVQSAAGGEDREAAALVGELDAHRPWFIKDPRLCLTLPQWRSRCEVPVAVICLRDIAAAANSLAKRGPIAGHDYSSDEALALCKAYLVLMVRHARELPRVVVRYEALLARPWQETQRLHEQLQALELGSGLRRPSRAEVERFVDASLQRSASHARLRPLNEEMEAALAADLPDLSHWLDADCLHHLEVIHHRRLAAEQLRAERAAEVTQLVARLSRPQMRRILDERREPDHPWSFARLRSLLE